MDTDHISDSAVSPELSGNGNAVEREDSRVEWGDLTPEVRKVMKMTRRLVIGIGGVGFEGTLALAYGMSERNMRFGVPDGRTRNVIDAVVMDSFDENVDPAKSPEAEFLYKEMGAHACHVSLATEDREEFRRRGIEDRLTPGLPDKGDRFGNQAVPKVGVSKYAVVRKLPIRDEQHTVQNPRALIKEVIGKWKDPTNPNACRRERDIYIDLIAGMSGGTGPAILAVYADTLRALKEVFGEDSGHTFRPRFFLLSGEPFKLDKTKGDQKKRDFNSLVTAIYLNSLAFDERVALPDGEELPVSYFPNPVYILDGQSTSTKVPEGGAYQPIRMAAKYLMAEITRINGSKTGEALSSIRAAVENPDNGTGGRALRKFAALGVCETLPHAKSKDAKEDEKGAPPVIMEMNKRKELFSRTVGLDELDLNTQANVDAAVSEVMPRSEDFVAQLLHQVETAFGNFPIEASNILIRRQEKEAGSKARQAVQRMRDTYFPASDGQIEECIRTEANSMCARLGQCLGRICCSEGLFAERAMLLALLGSISAFSQKCNEEIDKLRRGRTTTIDPQMSAALKNVQDKSIAIPWLIGREKAVVELNSSVDDFVERLQNKFRSLRMEKIFELLKNILLPQLKRALTQPVQENDRLGRIAIQALNAIKPAHDPARTGATAMDHVITVNPQWAENPDQMRDQLPEFSEKEFDRLIRSIHLTAADMDILSKITPDVAEAVCEWAQPFYIDTGGSMMTVDEQTRRQEKNANIAILSVPQDFVAKTDPKTGEVTELRGIKAPADFRPTRAAGSNRVVAIKERHDLSPFARAYFVDTLRAFMKLSSAEREEFFIQKGDMEKMLPPFAEELAKREMIKDKTGSVVDCAGCHLKFYRPQSDTVSTCCPGCRNLPQTQQAGKTV